MDEQTRETKEKAKQDTMLLWMKLQTCLTGGILALLLVVGLFVGIQAANVMKLFRGVDVERINATVLALQDAAGELQSADMETVNQAIASLKGAAENLANADVAAVNDGIQALTAAAENLQKLDVAQINKLIESLESVTAEMQKTTSAFNKLFGR